MPDRLGRRTRAPRRRCGQPRARSRFAGALWKRARRSPPRLRRTGFAARRVSRAWSGQCSAADRRGSSARWIPSRLFTWSFRAVSPAILRIGISPSHDVRSASARLEDEDCRFHDRSRPGWPGRLCGQFQQDPAGDHRNTRPGDQGDPPDGSRQAGEGEGHASLTRCRGARSRERARLDGVEWRRATRDRAAAGR